MNLTDTFLQNIYSLRKLSVSTDIEQLIRTYLVDTIGVTLAGAKDLSDREKAWINLVSVGVGTVRPIGVQQSVSVSDAIFLNGLSSHFHELDDGVRYGVIHPSAPLFSALIPMAIANKVSWTDFVKGAICGYEVSIRLAAAMQPSHYSRGYHPTATCCAPGIAVGIAVMKGWEDKIVKDAFSAACISAAGTLKVLEDVSQLKPFNCANAARNGYTAAMMAKAGFSGPNDVLIGDTGYLKMMSDKYNEDILIGKRDYLYLEKIYQKPYASCRHTHPEIEACFRLRKDERFNLNKIDRVKVTTYKGVIGKHDFKDIHGESSARMSIPYSVAIALTTGKAGIIEFAEPYVSDNTILELTQKVDVISSEELSILVPDKRVAIVEVVMKNGMVLCDRVDYPKGEPENPLSQEEILTKFLFMTDHAGLSNDKAMSIYEELNKSINPDFSILW